ncbi:hypothetical protein [Paucisalibacillus globulus]|uniref:hypothetical protein n=1 Tax=Paucisalibacillus globulus TaxID=351095 RepID=UPI000BB9903D|nr:hypothetical protein [Paucisalibacillus globulus]
MNKFDRHVKQNVRGYLEENISISERELSSIHQKIQNRRRSFNFAYISAFTVLSIILFISILPFIQHKQNLEFSPVPYSTKHAEEKEQPVERNINNTEDEPPLKEVEIEQEEIGEENIETEAEKEAKFLELLVKYNKLRDYKIEYNHSEVLELDKSTGYNVGYKIIGYKTLQEFSSQFSDFATTNAVSKMFHPLFENDEGLYLVATEHYRYLFEVDENYELTKIAENKYQITQTTQSDLGDHVFFNLWFEFTKIDGKWLITDWDSSEEITYEPEPEIEPEIISSILYTLGEYNLMSHSYFETSDDMVTLKNGKKAFKVRDFYTEFDFYNQFHLSVSKDVAENIWKEYILEQDGEIYILPSKYKYYYPIFDIDYGYEIKELEKGKYQVTQSYSNTYYSEIEDAIYNLSFVIENINDFYVITGFTYSIENN